MKKRSNKSIYFVLMLFTFLLLFIYPACPDNEAVEEEDDEAIVKSSDSSLSSLSFSAGTLDPVFNKTVLVYDLNAWNPPLRITAVSNHQEALIEISINAMERKTITSGVEYPYDLSQDMHAGNNTLAVCVTAEDGSSTIYFVDVVI